MGQQVREIFGWARRRKLLASAFLVLTLVVGILIGSIVSGRTSAMKARSGVDGAKEADVRIGGDHRHAAEIARSNSFVGVVFWNRKPRRARRCEHRYDSSSREEAEHAETPNAARRWSGLRE